MMMPAQVPAIPSRPGYTGRAQAVQRKSNSLREQLIGLWLKSGLATIGITGDCGVYGRDFRLAPLPGW